MCTRYHSRTDAPRHAPRFLRRSRSRPRRVPRLRQRLPDAYLHATTTRSRAARAFAARLARAGLQKGDAVLIWSENRPEWIVALWGCLLQGVVAVPIDYRASPDFLAPRRRHRARRACCWSAAKCRSDDVREAAPARVVARRARLERHVSHSRRRDDARRRGRDHLHVGRDRRTEGRRHHAPQHPREHRARRTRDR